MEDEWLREMTASERLSLEEEYENQQLWIDDDQKLTFLVFDAEQGTVETGLAEASSDGDAAEHERHLKGLAGDVNIFMLEPDHAEDYAEISGAAEAFVKAREHEPSSKPSTRDAPVTAEIMVMMAEPSCRRKGLAFEAVCAMMRYGMGDGSEGSGLGISTFVAKISEDNLASIRLFTDKLGFVEAKRIKAFNEVHLVCGPKQGLKERVLAVTEASGYKAVNYTWGS